MALIENFFQFIGVLGLMGWPLLLCSIAAGALIAERLWFALKHRHDRQKAEDVWGRGESAIRNFSDGPFQTLLWQHWIHRKMDWQVRREAAEVSLLQWIETQKRPIRSLRLIAQIAPLMGLTGTVLGLVEAFRVIQSQSTGINPSLLAGGIWEALLTTVVGMLICIPVLIALRFFNGRLDQIVLELRDLNGWLHRQELSAGSSPVKNTEPTPVPSP